MPVLVLFVVGTFYLGQESALAEPVVESCKFELLVEGLSCQPLPSEEFELLDSIFSEATAKIEFVACSCWCSGTFERCTRVINF
jgi:hypothetical protein